MDFGPTILLLLLGLAGLLDASSRDVGPEEIRGGDAASGALQEGCTLFDSLTFPADTTKRTARARETLAAHAAWARGERGRTVVVAGPGGPLPREVQLGFFRTTAVRDR